MPLTTVSSTAFGNPASPVKLDDHAAPDDNTDRNASASAHGLLPKLSNVVTEFLTGTGTWAVPAGTALTTAAEVYTPTRSAESNLDANVTMSEAQYMRVGATVTVSGRFTANPTAGGAASFEFTLPIASNLGAVEDLAGVAFAGGIAGQGAAIYGSVANNTAVVGWIAVDTSEQIFSFICCYQII